MKKKILVVAAVIISSQLQAQKDSSKIMDEVVLTATKTLQKQSATGKVITVINKEQIEKSTGKTVSQLLNEQAGITINGAFNNAGSNQSVYMRGASGGRTLILLDGIPVNDPSLINNEFDLNLLSLNDVERIEICRGAQSTLYGSDAVAGVVNIITVKQDISRRFNVKAMLSGGSYGTFRGNLQLYGKVNRFVYTLRYAKLSSKGFSTAYDSTGTKDFDKDKYNGDVMNAMVKYQLTTAFTVKAFVQNSRYKTDVDAGIFADEKDYTIKNKNLITGAGIIFNKNGLSLTANYQYSDISRNYLNDSIDKPGFTKYSTDDYFGKNQFVEAYANIQLGKGFSILQGADYRHSNMNNEYLSISAFGPYTNQFKDTVQSQASLYGSLFYSGFSQKLNIELGGRLNVHSRYGSNTTFTFNPSYAIDKHFRVFGSIASAFKAPSLYQLYSAYGNGMLTPETGTTYELGLQQQHAIFSNRFVYFNRIISNGIDFDNNNYQYLNINKQTVKGFEWEGTVKPVEALTVSFNFTYFKPEERSQSRVTFKDTTYDHLLRRPKSNFNINVGYRFKNGLFVNLAGKYVSERFDVGGYQKNDIRLDSYFLLGAHAEYKIKSYLKLFADAQNITNKKFFDIRGYNSIPLLVNGGIVFNW